MMLNTADTQDQEIVQVPTPRFMMCRVATVMLISSVRPASPVEAAGSVLDALAKDTRIPDDLDRPDLNQDWTIAKTIYPPTTPSVPKESLLRGSDAQYNIEFPMPVTFQIRVAKQHQPTRLDVSDVPTETYGVAWDGRSLVVTWEQVSPEPAISAGHVAVQVVADAAEAAGYGTYIQACSPGCDYDFMHTAMRLVGKSPDSSAHWTATEVLHLVDMKLPAEPDDLEVLAYDVWFELRDQLRDFASLKNLARRILDIEDSCRDDQTHLLAHNYQHASGKLRSPVKRVGAAWTNRSWRREARMLVARLWLSLSNIELLLRDWRQAQSDLGDAPADSLLILDTDFRDDARAVESMQLDHIAESVHQVVEVLDSRFVSLATAFGAIGGGVVGALLTLLVR